MGLGYVGTAVAEAHKKDNLVIRDPKLKNNSASIEEIKTCDAVYLCVPTPMLESGECDESFLFSVLDELQGYNKVIISKSTVPPKTYANLQVKFPNLVHAPEFLTAANSIDDYINSSWVLIGGEVPWTNEAEAIIKSSAISAKKYYKTNISTASLFKYIANSFLASKVTFMNDMYHLAKSLNVSWVDIKNIAANDSRLGDSHWDVPGPDGKFGFGGACFPKDVSAIIEHANTLGIDLELLRAVKSLNIKHRQNNN